MSTGTRFLLLWLAGLLMVPLLVWAGDRALLVGIDTYGNPRVPETPGAIEDARQIARLAEQRFGFPSESIRLLLGEEATARNIVEQFQSWLVEGTSPGDRVFFLYAGHGSQIADDNGDETDGHDETLAPFDIEPLSGENHIRDDVMDGLVAQLSGRRAVLIFDSCHSGTITRGLSGRQGGSLPGDGVRFLPRPEQMQRLWAEGSKFRTRSGDVDYRLRAVPGGQTLLDDPRSAGRLAGIVTIAAAGPGQLAYPIAAGDHYRGALSYVFEQIYHPDGSRGLIETLGSAVIEEAGEGVEDAASSVLTGQGAGDRLEELPGELSVAALESAIGHGMQRMRQQGQLQGNQEPWFEVISEHPIREEPLFGSWQQTPAVALSNPVVSQEVRLRTVSGQTTYQAGEHIEFEVETTRPGFLYLLVFSEQRMATCIYPQPGATPRRIPTGSYRIPDDDSYVFPVQPPYGEDLVVALVSQEKKRLCDRVSYTWEEIFERVDLDSVRRELADRSERGIGVQATASGIGAEHLAPAQRWQTATLLLRTEPRRRAGHGEAPPASGAEPSEPESTAAPAESRRKGTGNGWIELAEPERLARQTGEAPGALLARIQPPVVVSARTPRYTRIAQKSRVQGVVTLHLRVDAEGEPQDVEVLKGLPMGLSDMAVEAVRNWRFEPATLDGEPVEVLYGLNVNFRLQ